MPVIDLKLATENAFEDLAGAVVTGGGKVHHGPILDTALRIATLERGTKSGMPSVAIGAVTESGDLVVFQTTARAFVTAAKAIEARHPEVNFD